MNKKQLTGMALAAAMVMGLGTSAVMADDTVTLKWIPVGNGSSNIFKP